MGKKKVHKILTKVSRSGTSCTVQRTSSVVGKTCRTNENKNIHLLPPHQLCELTSSAETDALSDANMGCHPEAKRTIPECSAA